MDARRAILRPVDMNGRRIEINLLPAKPDKLADPQRMPEGHKDQRPIAERITAVVASLQQPVDLALRQILALPVINVLPPATANCRLFRLRGS
jgi:hypothetical protein